MMNTKAIDKKVIEFLKELVAIPERIEFLAYIRDNNIQSISFEEIAQNFDKTEDLIHFLKAMTEIDMLDYQVIDQKKYYSYSPKSKEIEELLERFYKNYTTAKNIFYKKAEKDFYEKSSDIRKDKELLDEQVKDLAVFTAIGEEVRKIFRLDDLFDRVPHFCVDLLNFQSGEFFMMLGGKPTLISAKYSDGSEKDLDFDEYNELLRNNKVGLEFFERAEKEMVPFVSKTTDKSKLNVKNEIIMTKFSEEGQTTGYLVVGYGIDHKRVTDRDINRMSVFTNNISIALSTVRLFDELDKKVQQRTEELNKASKKLRASNEKMELINKEMQRELTVASNIQSSMIPKEFPEYPNVQIGAAWFSMTEVSGDYYDIIPIEAKKKIGFLVADVSGHGVPAALITTMAKVSFSSHAQTEETTAGVCKKANIEIYESIGDIGFYLTAFFGIFDAATNQLQFTNAGHQMAIWQHGKDGSLEEITSDGFFIGSFEEAEYGYSTITLEKDDKVMFFTDGIVEARNPEGEFYEDDPTRLPNFFKRNKDLHADEFVKKLIEEVETFANGRPPNDDRTILVIECTADAIGAKFSEVTVF